MLVAGIIEPIEESDWVSPMVVQEKKHKGEIHICMDLRKHNNACVNDPFPTPFTDEVLENVGGKEAYSFTDGLSRYHQIKITLEDRSKITFDMECGCFQYTMIPFGLKNVLAVFSRIMGKLHSRNLYMNSWKSILMTGPSLASLRNIPRAYN